MYTASDLESETKYIAISIGSVPISASVQYDVEYICDGNFLLDYYRETTQVAGFESSGNPHWEPYSVSHQYTCDVVGGGGQFALCFTDVYYGENSGSITVNIYRADLIEATDVPANGEWAWASREYGSGVEHVAKSARSLIMSRTGECDAEYLYDGSVVFPSLRATLAGCWAGVLLRQFAPGRFGPENSEYSLEAAAVIYRGRPTLELGFNLGSCSETASPYASAKCLQAIDHLHVI